MLVRTIVALIGIPLLLLALFWPGGLPYLFIAMLIGWGGVLEMETAQEANGDRGNVIWPLAGVGLLLVPYAYPDGERYRLPGLVALFLCAMLWEVFSTEPKPFGRLSRLLLMTAYPGLIAVSVALRQQPGVVTLGIPASPAAWVPEAGAFWVMVAFLLVWTTDTGAYYVGRTWGKTELASHLSPSKTWEGAVGGGFLAAVMGGLIAHWAGVSLFPGGPLAGVLLGAMAGVWGQIGDLCESAFKRELGIKDFGGWLPGHGGVLDRFDSFFFVCPLVYLWSRLFT